MQAECNRLNITLLYGRSLPPSCDIINGHIYIYTADSGECMNCMYMLSYIFICIADDKRRSSQTLDPNAKASLDLICTTQKSWNIYKEVPLRILATFLYRLVRRYKLCTFRSIFEHQFEALVTEYKTV